MAPIEILMRIVMYAIVDNSAAIGKITRKTDLRLESTQRAILKQSFGRTFLCTIALISRVFCDIVRHIRYKSMSFNQAHMRTSIDEGTFSLMGSHVESNAVDAFTKWPSDNELPFSVAEHVKNIYVEKDCCYRFDQDRKGPYRVVWDDFFKGEPLHLKSLILSDSQVDGKIDKQVGLTWLKLIGTIKSVDVFQCDDIEVLKTVLANHPHLLNSVVLNTKSGSIFKTLNASTSVKRVHLGKDVVYHDIGRLKLDIDHLHVHHTKKFNIGLLFQYHNRLTSLSVTLPEHYEFKVNCLSKFKSLECFELRSNDYYCGFLNIDIFKFALASKTLKTLSIVAGFFSSDSRRAQQPSCVNERSYELHIVDGQFTRLDYVFHDKLWHRVQDRLDATFYALTHDKHDPAVQRHFGRLGEEKFLCGHTHIKTRVMIHGIEYSGFTFDDQFVKIIHV